MWLLLISPRAWARSLKWSRLRWSWLYSRIFLASEKSREILGGGGEEQEVRSSRSWRQDRQGGRVVYGAGPDSHGVVEVGDPARGLARGWTSETRVVGVAQDPLQPRQSTSRGQCLVREVTCGVRGQGSEVSITSTTTNTTVQ